MDKKQRKTLDIVSRLDDDIVNRHTEKRAHLLLGVKKRRFTKRLWISVGSAAAALLLVISSLLVLIPLLSKQVPIYTGMSVAGENTALALATATHTVQYADPGNTNNNGNHYGWHKGDSTDRAEVSDDMLGTSVESTLVVTGGEKSLYTANPGDDVYITIHIDNPDSFEILSFTLGGEKYSSYMFEEGSDMENIIIKVNVGNAQGIVNYTIDAIKYVDGEKIKDVRMEGDRTVKVGVAAKTQPESRIAQEEITFSSIRLGLTNQDELGLIAMTGGKLTAVLYDGNEIVEEKEISTETAVGVTFEGLSPNRVYQYAVVAHYDAFDGNGMADHVLLKKTFRTASPVLFDDVNVGVSTVSFSYLWNAGASERSVAATLYANGTKVRDIGNATSVEGLLPATAYTLITQYSLNGKSEQITLEFTTDQLFYTVRHLLSPLTGTEYVLESEQSVALMPGDIFAPAVKEIEGFTSPTAQRLAVSTEDGVRVIEYRYTRNTYNVSFNVNGVTTVKPLLYGATPESVTHPSLTFVGWRDAAGNKHTTVPARPITLYATFAGELSADDLLFSGSGEITITGLRNTAFTDLVIPAYVNGGKVVAIGASAFKNATYLSSVTLPATLTRVGVDAFGGCTELTHVIFDGTLAEWCNIAFAEDMNVAATTVNGHTFYPAARFASNPIVHAGSLYLTADPNVNVLAGALTLPTGTLSGTHCFAGAPTTTLVIPEGADTIPDGLLTGLYNLTTLRFNATNMPDMAETAPYRLLCAGVNGDGVAIEIGATVTRIPANKPFSGMKIRSITFAENSVCTEIGAYAFTTGCLDGWSMNYITELTLPDGLLTIGERAIYAKNATVLAIPASVTAISTNAFGGMRSLETLYYNCSATVTQGVEGYAHVFPDLGVNAENGTTVIIGAGVTAVPAGLFGPAPDGSGYTYDCNVSEIVFAQNSVCTEIAAGAFRGCATLSAVAMPATLISVGEGAFEGCTALATLSLPVGRFELPVLFGETSPAVTSVTLLGNGALPASAFEGWTTLTSVTLPEGVTAIGENAFKGCTALADITVPATVARVGVDAFIGCSQLKTIRINDLAAWCGITFETATDTSFPTSSPFYAARGDLYLNGTLVTDLAIPAGVTRINAHAFFRCGSILSASLPEGVTHIDSRAFGGCSDLTSISLPSTLEEIGYCAIAATGITSISLPTSLRVIGYAALCENYELTSIAVPEGVTSIGERAFRMCAIESATLPSTLQALGVSAFEECTNLTAIEVPAGITVLNASTFKNCSSLASVKLPASLAEIGANAFNGCAAIASIELPASLTSIGNFAFLGCAKLSSLALPAGVTAIGDLALRGCTSLTTLTLPNASKTLSRLFGETPTHVTTVTVLGGESVAYGAFNGYTGLTQVSLPSTVTRIENDAFRGCTALTAISLPSSLTSLGGLIFYGCTNLATVTFTEGSQLVSIGESVFYNCTSLAAIEIPAAVTSIGKSAFYGCTDLTAVTFAEGSALASIGDSIFRGCTSLTGISLPSGITAIGANAFKGCTKLTAIALPDGIERIQGLVFADCTSLSDITLPSALIYINGDAFKGCTALAEIDIPATVTFLGASAFEGCTALEEISIPAGARINGNLFKGCTALRTLTLPNAGTVLSALFGATPTHLTSVTILGGTSVVANAFSGCTGLTSIAIPSTVETIGNNTFKGCTNITTLTLPNASNTLSALFGATPTHVKSVTVLGGESVANNVFLNCTGLVSVSLPNTVTSIGSSAFRGCTALVMDTLPSGLTAIGTSSFEGCTGLTVDTLPSGLTAIGGSAFKGCTGLTVDTLPSGLLTVGTYAFSGCTGITNLSIPASVTSIGSGALNGCPLVSVSLPGCTGANGLFTSTVPETLARVTVVGTAIPDEAFYSNTWLDGLELIIAEGVTSIGDGAFYGCDASAVTFPSTLERIGGEAFRSSDVKTLSFLGGGISMATYAFEGCDRLKDVYISNADAWFSNSYRDKESSPLHYASRLYLDGALLTEITIPAGTKGYHALAFYGCTSLTTVNVADIATWLALEFGGEYANPMQYAENLLLNGAPITEVTVSSGTTAIRDHAFQSLASLQSVTLPEGVTHIGANAFAGCTALTTLSLPSTLEYVGYNAFGGCTSLSYYSDAYARYLGNEQNNYVVLMGLIDLELEAEQTVVYTMPDQTKILYGCGAASNYKDFVWGSNLVCIAGCGSTGDSEYADFFPGRTLPASLKYMGKGMYDHISLSGGEHTVEIPDSVIHIAPQTFYEVELVALKVGRGIEVLDFTTQGGLSAKELYLTNALQEIRWGHEFGGVYDIYFDGTEEEWLAIEGASAFAKAYDADVIFLQE